MEPTLQTWQAAVDCGVAAVVVSYRPQPGKLQALVDALRGQVDGLVVVDNGSPDWHAPLTDLPLQVLRLPSNEGLAAAQNQGLALALAAGAGQILLLDQDSRPAPGMVAELRQVLAEASVQGLRVAAVGPQVLDRNGSCDGFVRFARGRYEALQPKGGLRWLHCDLLIASGSLLDAAALRHIGLMDAGLFIDKVDTDWSLRAAELGYSLLGVPSAVLHHNLGERRVRIWFGRWRELPQHQPFRYYYMVRNSLLLQGRTHAHAAWRRADRRQLLSLLLYFGLLATPRRENLLMMWRGLCDGLRGRSGAQVPALKK